MENQNLEYKETFNSGKIKEDIAMFANSDEGGEIWIGFKDDGSPAKQFIFKQQTLDQFINEVKQQIIPVITTITVNRIMRDGLTDGVIFNVGKSIFNYHTYKGQLYVRSGSVRIPASKEELKMRQMNGGHHDYTSTSLKVKDSKPCMEDLDTNALNLFKEKISKKEQSYTNKNIRDILISENLLDGENPSMTAFLFLGKYENRFKFLPSEISTIHYLYEDTKNNIEERFDLEVPWILNIDKLFGEIKKRNFTIQDINLFRPDEKQYEDKSVEEAVVNSIAHRNWIINSWIEIIHTPNQLKIYNPGIFRPKLNDLLSKDKNYEYQNTAMCNFLKSINLMERERKGIKNKIYNLQIKKGLTIEVNQQEEKGTSIERVEFILNGQIKDINFAKLIYKHAPEINFNQVLILDKISSGQNLFNKDISLTEYELVKNYVLKGKGKSDKLKIRDTIFSFNQKPLVDASMKSIESLILDYAKEKYKNSKKEFTVEDIYNRLGSNGNTIRAILSYLCKKGYLIRVERGVYTLQKNN